jgi:hypothetical protein
MRNISKILLSIALVLSGGRCLAAEAAFDGITCQMDITKTLMGRSMPSGRVVEIEAKYSKLGLKNIEGYGLPEDPYFLGTWLICGSQYLILRKPSSPIIQDVLKSPTTYSSASSTIANCSEANKSWRGVIIFQPETAKPPWSTQEIWEIDQSAIKFRHHTGKFNCDA